MAKIGTYAIDSNVTLSDKLIGTDVDNMNATKNFTVGDIANVIQSSFNCFGSFYHTLTQNAGAINTAYALAYNSVDANCTNGVVIANDSFSQPTIINVSKQGVYNIQFSAQIKRASGSSPESVNIWLVKNGVNVPNSNTFLNVQGSSGYLVAAWNFFIDMDITDDVQIMWATSATNISIFADSPIPPHPATPSVILTVNKID